MNFQSQQIANLISESAAQREQQYNGDTTAADVALDVAAVDLHPAASASACDVAYAIFLEPDPDADPNKSFGETCIDTAIRLFQPIPTIAHCELLIPPVPATESMRVQFATYINQSSSWKVDQSDNFNYYLTSNTGRWRALPIFGKDVGRKLRSECDLETGVPYSLGRYITSAKPFRALSWVLPRKRRSPAHCATLVARVITRAVPNTLANPEGWYGPSSLFLELRENAKEEAVRMQATTHARLSESTINAIDALLRGQISSVPSLGDEACIAATRALTVRACADLVDGDEVAQKLSQKQLAAALLKWVVLRPKQHE